MNLIPLQEPHPHILPLTEIGVLTNFKAAIFQAQPILPFIEEETLQITNTKSFNEMLIDDKYLSKKHFRVSKNIHNTKHFSSNAVD